jgi:hypothetical protein
MWKDVDENYIAYYSLYGMMQCLFPHSQPTHPIPSTQTRHIIVIQICNASVVVGDPCGTEYFYWLAHGVPVYIFVRL